MNRFKSESTGDEIELCVISKAHRAVFTLKFIESPSEHIKLISDVEGFLRKNDIKWVEIDINNPIIPVNSVCYKNKYTNNTVCHIEDFSKFYFANIKKLIQVKNIKFNNKNKPIDNKGWVTVQKPQKYRENIYNEIMKELETFSQTLLNDWSK